MSLTDIKAQVKTVMLTVSGVGTVDTKKNVDGRRYGNIAWFKDPRPGKCQWEIHAKARQEDETRGIGTQAFKYTNVEIEGWMPSSYTNPSTTETWEALLDNVCDTLRANRSLNLTINSTMLPQVRMNNFEAYNDGEKIVLCHHCVVDLRVRESFSYTTA